MLGFLVVVFLVVLNFEDWLWCDCGGDGFVWLIGFKLNLF